MISQGAVQPAKFQIEFSEKKRIGSDAFAFYFTPKQDFAFLAGQYLQLTLPHQNPDTRGIKRFFTIASSPQEDKIMIATRIIQSSFKKALFTLPKGKKLECFGPLGSFTMSGEQETSRIFLAGGIGITPFRSILLNAAFMSSQTPLTLFASFSTPQELVFYDELINLSKDRKSIKVIYTISHPENSQTNWSGERGRISAELIKKYVQDCLSAKYFISGPPKMVEAMVEIVGGMGVFREQIKKENFTGY